METLDVTQIEPRRKHPVIFAKYDDLTGGGSFIIHNDHDPKPLYYQMLAEKGKTFDWQYVTEGPDVWEVKITKLEQLDNALTIGEIAAGDFRKAEVFKKFGLDFCCGGSKSVEEACNETGVDRMEVEKALMEVENKPGSIRQDYDQWELDFLSDYIVNIHHKYVAGSLPMLLELSTKVAEVHGERYSRLVKIASLFEAVADELKMHMLKEENILFPYVKKLAEANRRQIKISPPPFYSIENPINMMEAEHASAGGNMSEIRRLSNSFAIPDDACSSFKLLYNKLEEFEQDLHLHIHLENNILFPKAIKLEGKLVG